LGNDAKLTLPFHNEEFSAGRLSSGGSFPPILWHRKQHPNTASYARSDLQRTLTIGLPQFHAIGSLPAKND